MPRLNANSPLASRLRRFLPIGLLGLAASGCTPTPKLNVEDQWEKSVKNLKMFAMYPLPEDVQVGDIFLYAPERRGVTDVLTDVRFKLTRIGSMRPRTCLTEALSDQQATRLRIESMAPTKPLATTKAPSPASDDLCGGDMGDTARPAVPASGKGPVETQVDVGNVLNTTTPVRMRRAAVPSFTAATLTQGQLGGAGIFGAIGAAIGLGASADTAITITLTDLEELSLDASAAIDLEFTQGADFLSHAGTPEKLLYYLTDSRPDLVGAFCKADFKRLEDEEVCFIIANRVMYAHTIEYGYRNESAVSGAITATPAANNAAAVAAGVPSVTAPAALPAPGASATAGKPLSPDEAVSMAQTRLAAMQAAVAANVPKTPGINVSYGFGRLGSSTLSVTYDQPLVVGVGSPIYLSFGQMNRLHFRVIAGQFPPQRVGVTRKERKHLEALMTEYNNIVPTLRRSIKNVDDICENFYGIPGWAANAAQVAKVPGRLPADRSRLLKF